MDHRRRELNVPSDSTQNGGGHRQHVAHSIDGVHAALCIICEERQQHHLSLLHKWMSSVRDKSFADDPSPDMQTFLFQYYGDKNCIAYQMASNSAQWRNQTRGTFDKIAMQRSSATNC